MKLMSGLAWKAAAATVLMACAISPAFGRGGGGGGHGGGGGGHGGGGHGVGGHMGGGGYHGGGYHGGGYHGGGGFYGGFGGLGFGGLGYGLGGLGYGGYGGYGYGGNGGYWSAYPNYTYSNDYSPAPTTAAAPYLTDQTYEPGDGYRYPLYYNPATASYFYYPVAR